VLQANSGEPVKARPSTRPRAGVGQRGQISKDFKRKRSNGIFPGSTLGGSSSTPSSFGLVTRRGNRSLQSYYSGRRQPSGPASRPFLHDRAITGPRSDGSYKAFASA